MSKIDIPEIPLRREKSFTEKILDKLPDIHFRSDCCNGLQANDCMNHNKLNLGAILIVIGFIIGCLITFLIMNYIVCQSVNQ